MSAELIIKDCIVYKCYVDDIVCLIDGNRYGLKLLRTSDEAHRNLRFTMELESRDKVSFFGVSMFRRDDGSVQRSVRRKATWNGQYVYFRGFVPLKMKRDLIMRLKNKAKKICLDDTIEEELSTVHSIFLENGYPAKMIDRVVRSKAENVRRTGVGRKIVYISLSFKGDATAEIIDRRLSTAVTNASHSVNLWILFNTRAMVRLQLKDKMPVSAASFCVYSFTCFCVQRVTRLGVCPNGFMNTTRPS